MTDDAVNVVSAVPVARWWDKPLARAGVAYVSALVVCVVVLYWAYGLGAAHLRIPFHYQNDTMFYQIVIKGMLDHGWFLDNPSLSAPGSLNLRDVPTSDNNFHFLVLKVLGWFFPHYPLVLNLFYLLGFPLTVVCALYVLRQCGVSWLVAVAGSLLYTFLPYHMIRGEHHLFLSMYWQVPLLVLVLLWLWQGELDVTARGWRAPKLWWSVLLGVVLAASGYYYAFFGCFFLLMVAVLRMWEQRNWRAGLSALVLIAVIGAGSVANLWPSIRHVARAGSVHVILRVAAEADIYGLRIAQMLMPVRWHRWQSLSDLKVDYNMRLLINENDDASLGFIGALGLLGLLGWFLLRRPAAARLSEPGRAGLLNQLSMLTWLGVLLATMGGFGSLVAFFGAPQVRAYNRISIFLGFFALLAVALWLDQLRAWLAHRWNAARWLNLAFGGALALLVWVGLLDQISPRFLPDYRALTDEYMSDEVFVKYVEKQAPPGTLIFQLPVMSFPENPKIGRILDYDHARPYLHSQHLRWSYGTIKGREDDFWVRRVAALPPPEMAATLAWAGFGGIYLDRWGYADNGAQLEAEFSALLGAKPLHSPTGRQLFFDLAAYRDRLRAQTPSREWAAQQEAARHPVMALWLQTFSDLEGAPGDNWRWCGARGQMQLVNRTARAQEFAFEMDYSADNDGVLTLTGFLNERLTINRQLGAYRKTLTIPPGIHTVNFACDARRILTPNDFRELVFRVRNFKLRAVGRTVELKTLAPVAMATAMPQVKAAGVGNKQ